MNEKAVRIDEEELEIVKRFDEGDFNGDDLIISDGKDLEVMPNRLATYPVEGYVELCTVNDLMLRYYERIAIGTRNFIENEINYLEKDELKVSYERREPFGDNNPTYACDVTIDTNHSIVLFRDSLEMIEQIVGTECQSIYIKDNKINLHFVLLEWRKKDIKEVKK